MNRRHASWHVGPRRRRRWFGCVAFWLLTGRLPFEATDAVSMLLHHASTAPTAPGLLAEEPIPHALDQLVIDCLSKDPSMRPSTAHLTWKRLDEIHLASPWNPGRAQAWWEAHAPEAVAL